MDVVMIQFSKFFKPSATVGGQPCPGSPQRWCHFTLQRKICGGNREEFTLIAFHFQFKGSLVTTLACVRSMEHFSTGWSAWNTWDHIFFCSLCLTTMTTKALAQILHHPVSIPTDPLAVPYPQPIKYLTIDKDIKGLSLVEVTSEISLSKHFPRRQEEIK